MKITQFIKDVRSEMVHVKWPTRKMAAGSTVAVIIISIITGAYLGALDTGLKKGLTKTVEFVSGPISTATSTPATSTSTVSTSTATTTNATNSVIKK